MKGWREFSQVGLQPQIGLLAIAGAVIGLQLHWNWLTYTSPDQLTLSLLFWGAGLYLLWQKRHHVSWETTPGATWVGTALLLWFLVRSWSNSAVDDVLGAIAPLFACVGLSLLASGWRGPHQFTRELLVVLILNIPQINLAQLVESQINLSLLTAKLSTFLLWYLGFPVSRQGITILLPTGAVDVLPGCSGLDAILLMTRLALLFVVFFGLRGVQRWWVPAIAILIAFSLNALRVMLMVLLLAFQPGAFEFWHGSGGAQVFSTIMIVAFGLVCQRVLHSNQRPTPVNPEEV